MAKKVIRLEGVREHNLKNLSLELPHGKFIVVTGVSGSGKSTLAFNVLFSEGQRRFLDSMNAYARQFVQQLPRADLDYIEGIPPAVSIEQRSTRGGGKSTVGTLTEVYHFFRLLYARLGVQYCEDCDIPITGGTRENVIEEAQKNLAKTKKGKIICLAPILRGRKGTHIELLRKIGKQGFQQVRVDREYYHLEPLPKLSRYNPHDIDVVVFSQLPSADEIVKKLEEALSVGKGVFSIITPDGEEKIYSAHRSCPKCARSYPQLDPYDFSFNSPRGWCPSCRGFGETFYLPDVKRGVRAEDIEESWFSWMEEEREVCHECHGSRLKPMSRMVRLPVQWFSGLPKGPSLAELVAMNADQALKLFSKIEVKDEFVLDIVRDIFPEVKSRLSFLNTVGLDYLCLDRGIPTLSGGEAQRIRLAAQLGSTLSGVLYVLDEPTIGLHARDNALLISSLKKLRSQGNTLLVVEHDEDTMREADYLVDMGPGAGVRGGEIVFQGTLQKLLQCKKSQTAQFLSNSHCKFPARGERRSVNLNKQQRAAKAPKSQHTPSSWLTLKSATLHNLKGLTVKFPLNRFIVITGVSGSGKSSLARGCLYSALKQHLEERKTKSTSRKKVKNLITGAQSIRAIYEVDQSPIGRTPRSVPATYIGFFDLIRKIFAQTPDARTKGYQAGRFSFNSKLGRCTGCSGAGLVKISMNFMPPAYIPCNDCGGSRFNPETLDVHYQGKNIAEVLDMSVEEAIAFFKNHSRVLKSLKALSDTGLDYIKLGQSSPTLSGGEAQRMKLVTHLLGGLEPKTQGLKHAEAKGSFFILEEPTIGLHASDVEKLVSVIQQLVDVGNTVLVIEHNYDLIAEADWVIDMGPEGGEGGGRIVAEGTPEEVAQADTWTGKYLKEYLSQKSSL
ncbi:MAG: excinuclease ABC subunit A [Verrucomicrobiota bacterium]|jgi:excinuclease ABC subunit A|nr:excinuclease ABC subunit A [Verrucomicrobiota bacterium]